MESAPVCRRTYHIELSNIDFRKELKLSALFEFFQDIASAAAEELGFGIEFLREKFGVAWVLARIRAEVYRTPVWNEEITIESWPDSQGKMSFERDFTVLDRERKKIAAAVSTWVLLDVGTRKMKRTDLIGFKTPPPGRERALDCRLGGLRPSKNMQEVYKKAIGYSDIDLNGHINNAKYVDYAMDCLNVERYSEHPAGSIELDYISEALPGDLIVLKKDENGSESDQVFIEGCSCSSGKTVFRALLDA